MLNSEELKKKSSLIKEKYKHLLKIDDFRRTGDVLNEKYLLEGFLGSGGMGWVYLGSSIHSDEIFAIKLLKPEIVSKNPQNIKLFHNEVIAAQKLRHPNIVSIKDSGTDENHRVSYIVMELLEGKTLDNLMMNQKLTQAERRYIFLQICEAFIYAHSKNVLHLDIKPENIFITKQENGDYKVTIIDFGIAKIISSESGTTVTQFRGSPMYCSPEHFSGKLSYYSDIYSLTATLYFLFSGVFPFGNSYLNAKVHPNLELPPIPDVTRINKELPEQINKIIAKGLNRNPLERYASVSHLMEEFNQVFSNKKEPARPVTSNPVVKVIGVGGVGCQMIYKLFPHFSDNFEFVAIDFDSDDIRNSKGPTKFILTQKNQNVYKFTASRNIVLEFHEKLMDFLEGANLVFIIFNMDGDTGAGISPVIASFAYELGALTLVFGIEPSRFNSKRSPESLQRTIAELTGGVDAQMSISPDAIFRRLNSTDWSKVESLLENYLFHIFEGFNDLLFLEGTINLGFSHLKTTLRNKGSFFSGAGYGKGEKAALEAMRSALHPVVIKDEWINERKNLLIQITCSQSISEEDINQAVNLAALLTSTNVNIFLGVRFEEKFIDEVKVLLIAT